MILVTVTHERGIELATAKVIAIDPEKIVSVRTRNGVAEIDYGESYVRNRETVTYRLTANAANISATIQGDYVGKVYLALTVVMADNRDIRPELGTTSYALDLCEKYIVDIEETVLFYAGAKHDVTKIRYIPASFVPETIYVSQEISRLVTDTPSETTTTTTAAPLTTTTTEEPVTTTTEEATTTTTEEYDEIYLSKYYYVGAPPPVTEFGDTLESACETIGMSESVTFMYTWAYLVPDGDGSFYVYDHYDHLLLAEGYYLYFDGNDYVIYYVDENGLTDLVAVECETTTTTTLV